MDDAALCPLCLASADPVELAGQKGHLCSECDAVVLRGPSVQVLAGRGVSQRDLSPAVRKALASSERLPDVRTLMRGLAPCPFCQGALEAFRFGGGTSPAVRCRRCERVAFPRGALALALEEQRNGSTMTSDQKEALRDLRIGSALGRHLGAEVMVIGLMLTGLILLIRSGVVLPTWAFVILAVLVGGYVVLRIQRAKADEHEAEKEVERIAEAEALKKKKKRSAAASLAGGYCAWCGSKLPPNAARCDACDSDFG